MRPFLTAGWRNLVLLNYVGDPERLSALVPSGVELDFHDDKAFVSLVAFQFLDTRVRGLRIPGHVDFVEVNLRFYVRRGDRRGVVFIKEIVPRPLVAWVARTVYGEPYETWRCGVDGLCYEWSRDGCENSVQVTVADSGKLPEAGSHAEFITEHYWGYTKRGLNRTDEYRVDHPRWEHFEVQEWQANVSFSEVYGSDWGFLGEQVPYSVLFARGSEVAVFRADTLKSQ